MPSVSHHAVKRVGRAPKEVQVKKLIERLKSAESIVLANLSCMKVHDITKLRSGLRKQGGQMIVAKNRLISRALAEAGYPSVDNLLKGPTAVAFATTDPSIAAKMLLDLKKDNEKIVIKGGIFEGAVLDEKKVKDLSVMPGRPVVLGRLVGSLNAPGQKLVFALNQTVSKFVYALDALRQKLENAG